MLLASQRVINHLNSLTQHTDDCNMVNSFKRCFDRYNKDINDTYNLTALFPSRSHHELSSSRVNVRALKAFCTVLCSYEK